MSVYPDVTGRIEEFREDLSNLADTTIVRKYITYGNCYILGEDGYFDLKSEVSDQFNVHPNEVVVVGSGKLGFSIAKRKRYRHFGDESDIDIAIVSGTLFDQIWGDVFQYKIGGAYWPEERDFKDYLFRGWVRPDKLPPTPTFEFRNQWWDFFLELERRGNYGPYKIRAGVYKSWHFLESYQTENVRDCR